MPWYTAKISALRMVVAGRPWYQELPTSLMPSKMAKRVSDDFHGAVEGLEA